MEKVSAEWIRFTAMPPGKDLTRNFLQNPEIKIWCYFKFFINFYTLSTEACTISC